MPKFVLNDTGIPSREGSGCLFADDVLVRHRDAGESRTHVTLAGVFDRETAFQSIDLFTTYGQDDWVDHRDVTDDTNGTWVADLVRGDANAVVFTLGLSQSLGQFWDGGEILNGSRSRGEALVGGLNDVH